MNRVRDTRPVLEIRKDDLLITRAGPRSRAGVSCLVRASRPKLIVCDKAYRLRVDRERILPEFAEIVLNAPRTLTELGKMKTGTSESGMNLTQAKFKALEILLPALDEQAVIVERTGDLLAFADKLNGRVESVDSKLSLMSEAALSGAFRSDAADGGIPVTA